MTTVSINAPSKSYDVVIGKGLLNTCGDKIAEVCGVSSQSKAYIITDDNVAKLYHKTVNSSLKLNDFSSSVKTLEAGERSKNFKNYHECLKRFTEKNLIRSDIAVALGGGVVGDLTGFAASTYLRGIKFVQIPTTLLSMVDSSVGGKTAINIGDSRTHGGKNQVGTFYQPDIVICDYDTLKTLSDYIFADGMAEVIKHAIIRSEDLFQILHENKITATCDKIEDVIKRNVIIKRDIVAEDERDTGIRQLLNFGHTEAHGIEKCSNYSISHGSAVAIGMVIASRGAFGMNLCSEDCYKQVLDMVKRYNLPSKCDFTSEQLISAAFSDKKRIGDSIALVVPEKIGHCYLKTFSMNEMARFIRIGMGEES
ncbi:MAG: 3-dehydroquinate synthase [Oscillospiraceae bacterium]|nr:3-dehydroquinate synthase [Oscillospiraceae bacterium]